MDNIIEIDRWDLIDLDKMSESMTSYLLCKEAHNMPIGESLFAIQLDMFISFYTSDEINNMIISSAAALQLTESNKQLFLDYFELYNSINTQDESK